jgi:phosphoglycolate phosphatase
MKLALFDCDGTLVDSQHVIMAAMQAAFAEASLTWPGREATLAIIGLSLTEAFGVLVPEHDVARRDRLAAGYKASFHRLRQDPAHHEPLFEGVRDTLERLAAREDVVLGIATGKSQRGVQAVLAREGLDHHFVTIQTADDAPSKPHPGMVLQAMAAAGAGPQETVVIGDTSYDMMMARAAGAAALGVGWGYHPESALMAAGAQAIVSRFSDIGDHLDRLWQDAA